MSEYSIKIHIADAAALPISHREVARYLGYSREAIKALDDEKIGEAVRRLRGLIAPKACYCRYPLSFFDEDGIVAPYGPIRSRQLRKNLEGCTELYLFAATIGAAVDRELKRISLRSMGEAAYMQAAGAAAVEAVCDELNDKLLEEARAEGKLLKPRFSPGYGDLELSNQRGIFDILSPARYIGLTLMDSLIMSPEKSVTAFIGIYNA